MMDAHRRSVFLSCDTAKPGRTKQILLDLMDKGYHVLPGPAHARAVAEVLEELQTFARRRTPLNQNRTEQIWNEIAVPPESLTARTIFPPEIEYLLRAQFGQLSCVYWANHYDAGEYIPPHKDTLGDLQIVMTFAVPPVGFGGRLRIRHGCWSEIPVEVGERIVFDARQTSHSTTAVLPNDVPGNAVHRRVVGVCRLFFRAPPSEVDPSSLRSTRR